MKISLFAAGPILSFVVLAGFDAEASEGGNAESLAAAENAFAQESVAKGTRTAFLNALSDDGIAFAPGPQNGKKVWRAKKELDGVLEWHPVLAATSTNGDLGYTTGPWRFKKKGEQAANAFGQFVSIWRWEGGKWKLFFDLGSDNPAPATPDDAEMMLVDNHAPHEAPSTALAVMLSHDKGYAADRVGKISDAAEENVRLYLPNEFPIVERAAAATALARAPQNLKFGPAKSEVSKGGDLGYVWGEYRATPGGEATGDYLRIWRKDRAGDWKLALDLIHPR